MTQLNKGIHKISMDAYLADPCPVPSLSRGTIKDLLYTTPAQAAFNHPRLNPDYQRDEGEAKFDLGTAAHSLLLEGVDCCCVVDADDWRKKEARELRDQARMVGRTPLLRKQYDEALKMVAVARTFLFDSEVKIDNLQSQGESELTYLWTEGKTWFRIRMDWINNAYDLVLDYKTTAIEGGPEAFCKTIIQGGYDIQAALYLRGLKDRKIELRDHRFVFLVQETFEPYQCYLISLPPQFYELGFQKVNTGIRIWEWCMKKGEWPGYEKRIYYTDPQPWAITQWEERRFQLELGQQGEI